MAKTLFYYQDGKAFYLLDSALYQQGRKFVTSIWIAKDQLVGDTTANAIIWLEKFEAHHKALAWLPFAVDPTELRGRFDDELDDEDNDECADWFDLSAMSIGTLVQFVHPWDVFDSGVVPTGTICCISAQYLNEMQPALYLMPVDRDLTFLKEWGGEVHLIPPEAFEKEQYDAADAHAPAPLRCLNADLSA